jgi:acyl-CoA thioesterase-1
MLLRSSIRLLVCLLFFAPAPAALAAAKGSPLRIAVLGDSLTAGLGLSASEAFPARLEAALRARGLDVAVANAGVSGDTTAGGLARLGWTLSGHPQLVIVELGANDALRGLPPKEAFANLDAILTQLKKAGVQAILTGMRAPRNLGPEYYNSFNAIYPRLARKHDVPLYPFFLAGVVGDPALNQADGIHPNSRGVAVIVRRILPLVLKTIERMTHGGPDKAYRRLENGEKRGRSLQERPEREGSYSAAPMESPLMIRSRKTV